MSVPAVNARAPIRCARSPAARSVCTRTVDRSRPKCRSNTCRSPSGSGRPAPRPTSAVCAATRGAVPGSTDRATVGRASCTSTGRASSATIACAVRSASCSNRSPGRLIASGPPWACTGRVAKSAPNQPRGCAAGGWSLAAQPQSGWPFSGQRCTSRSGAGHIGTVDRAAPAGTGTIAFTRPVIAAPVRCAAAWSGRGAG